VWAWVTKLQGEGVKPGTIKYCLSVMNAIFTTALNDQLTAQHPCKGVKAPTVDANCAKPGIGQEGSGGREVLLGLGRDSPRSAEQSHI
jgi:hypothetical protein